MAKTIEQIIEHYAKHLRTQTFLDTTLVSRMLKRNGHDPKKSDDVCEAVLNLYIKNKV